jgi:hypothetical protein
VARVSRGSRSPWRDAGFVTLHRNRRGVLTCLSRRTGVQVGAIFDVRALLTPPLAAERMVRLSHENGVFVQKCALRSKDCLLVLVICTRALGATRMAHRSPPKESTSVTSSDPVEPAVLAGAGKTDLPSGPLTIVRPWCRGSLARRTAVRRRQKRDTAPWPQVENQTSGPNSTSTGVGVLTSVLNLSLPFAGWTRKTAMVAVF